MWTRSFHGTTQVTPAAAKMRLIQGAVEVIALLSNGPNVAVEVSAKFPSAVQEQTCRSVSEDLDKSRSMP